MLYSRDPLPLLLAGLAPPPRRLAYEAHQLPRSRQGRWLHGACIRRAGLVVAVTDRIAAAASAAGARATLVARDGFRAERYADLPPQAAARHALGLPPAAFIVGYVGQLRTLGMAKGVEQLVDALGRLRDAPCALAVVGGPAADVDALRARWQALGLPSELLFAPGQVAPDQVPLWLAAFDVGTIPFPDRPHFAECASPMKLFEYLAAGLPIVATRLLALAEVLVDGETALLTPPGDVAALAAALRRLRDEVGLRTALGLGARRAAATYTWAARAKRIIGALGALQA
jgi:glycosyltransferase involved in cell wall biosynthesis